MLFSFTLLFFYAWLLWLNYNSFTKPIFHPNTKIIWIYWDSLYSIPNIIKTNVECITKLYKDWKVIFLNKYNIHYYIPRNIIRLANGYIVQHKTDLYRLYLLKHYGGLWLDAGILVKDVDFINSLYHQCICTNKIGLYDITKFYNNNTGFPIIENWFVMSPRPNHYIINMWYEQFIKALKIGFKQYRHEIEVCTIYEYEEYLTMHACMQYLIQNNQDILHDIILHHSEDDMFYLQNISDWDVNHFKQTFLNIGSTLPCIKLRGTERNLVNDLDANTTYYRVV